MKRRQHLFVALICLLSLPALAELQLSKSFSSHMVLQRQMPIRVWGWADAGQTVAVTLAGQSASAKANDEGYWRVELPAMEADGKPQTMTVRGGDGSSIELTDILLGEVWIAAGQSNMNREVTIEGDHPEIRLFWIHGDTTPVQRDLGSNALGWVPATSDALQAIVPARNAFAKVYGAGTCEVGWVFGQRVHEQTGVPVGIIKTAFGGSTASAWTPIKNFTDEYTYGTAVEGSYLGHRKGLLYNTMLQGLGPMSVRGVVWYQGEDDGRTWDYDKDLSAMIASWRELFDQPKLPFYLAQIAQTTYASGMLRVWECQARVAAQDEHVYLGMSVNLFDSLPRDNGAAVRKHDGSDNDPGTGWPIAGGSNPHPPDKHIVANRLADLALVHTYGVKLDRQVDAPTYRSHTTEGNKLIVKFDHVGKGLKTDDGEAPNWFEISDGSQGERKGKKFPLIYHQATAKIVDKDTIELTAEGVEKPTQVRLAWHALARQNLTNSDGVPAVNFRSDTQETKSR